MNRPGSIDYMLEEIRSAISRCNASEKDTFEALMSESEGWEMRLQELEAEDDPE